MNSKNIIDSFEVILKNFQKTFLSLSDDFFFTEKELHSYFYHLCIQNNSFILKNGFNLVHTEYPTPFKCSKEKDFPFIKMRHITSKKIRSHIDMVIFNPNFIEWINQKGLSIEYIKGLKNQLYSEYIKDFIKIYTDFYNEKNETVFLYLLEFKFFRNRSEGTKQPLKSIKEDVEKLKMASKFQMGFMNSSLPFAKNILSLVFINNSNKKLSEILVNDPYVKKNKEYIHIIYRKKKIQFKMPHNILST